MRIYEDLFDEISADDFREDVQGKIESDPEEKPDPDDPRFSFIIDVNAPRMRQMTSRKTIKDAISKMSEMIESLLSTGDVTEYSRVAVYSSVQKHKDIDFFENGNGKLL